MADVETQTAEQVIIAMIQELIQRRGNGSVSVSRESQLLGDLGMDSLELAELSMGLTDDVGPDPFSQGLFPETVAELVAFYDS